MEGEKPRTVQGMTVVPYELALGPTFTRFLEGLKEEKIFGTKCKRCNRVLVPARPFCPRCFEPMEEWVEVAQEGTIVAWVYINFTYFGLEEDMIPIVLALIRVDGTDNNWLGVIKVPYIKDFDTVKEKVKIGKRVKVVWHKEKKGSMQDFHWEVIE